MTILTVHIIASAIVVLLATVYFWPTEERDCPHHGDEDEHDVSACTFCRAASARGDDSSLSEFLPEAEIERRRKDECVRP